MEDAYNNGKDLYAVIASSALENTYGDCLEFYPEGTELEVDGKKVVSGSGKEFEVETDAEDSIMVKYYEILPTAAGDKTAEELTTDDKILSDIGELTIKNIAKIDNRIKIFF